MNVLLRARSGLLGGGRGLLPATPTSSCCCPRFVATVLTDKNSPSLGSPTEDRRAKLDFPPFVKDLFIGKFNKSVLSYAEVINYDRYFVLNEQTSKISEYLAANKDKISAINQRGVVPEEILLKFKSLDLYGLLVPSAYDGAELLHTEALRLYEELGGSLALAELMQLNEVMCTKAIVQLGTDDQKSRYLPLISTGEMWTAYCLAEPTAGSDPNAIQTRARYDPETNKYHIKGGKSWVANAIRANLFLVFAKTRAKNYLGEDEDFLTAFLVDRDTPGVKVSTPYDLAAFNGLQVCDVEFDCHLPTSAVLGKDGEGVGVLQSINHVNKYFMAAGIIQRLKGLLSDTSAHVLQRKQYGTKLSEFELIRLQIGRCASRIYALESMLYITAGLADVGSRPDIEVESAIIKQFAAETFDYVTRTCLSILGAQTNLKASKYQEYLAENQVLQSWQGSSNIIKCFIGISGIIHLVNEKGEELLKCDQFGHHPFKAIKYRFNTWRARSDTFAKKHMIEHYVHPRMAKTAPLVDWSARKLALCAEKMVLQEGLNVQIKEGNLERLSDMTMETFAMVAVLARASRSYVVGHAHAQHDMSLAIPFIFESRQRVEQRMNELLYMDNMLGQRDLFYEDAGVYVIEHGGYISTHPLMKNSF